MLSPQETRVPCPPVGHADAKCGYGEHKSCYEQCVYETSWAQDDKKQWCDKDGKPYTDYCAAKCSCDTPVECPPPLSKCRHNKGCSSRVLDGAQAGPLAAVANMCSRLMVVHRALTRALTRALDAGACWLSLDAGVRTQPRCCR